ncbi:hydroxymethylbilane synthase [uncultured Eubacterium sp.]|uniref:hydroxymethylbilane synthase n=1 Tax=uncultured Eubacterium sp. TaxID=165185 RepID=UPI00343D1B2C
MAVKQIRIGSRESRLAVVQSEMVIDYIKENCPEYEPELVTMKTTGDKILDRNLDKIGGKGLFVKELDAALMDGRSDLSVHSLKDMPAEIPEELPLLGFSEREDPRDVLVLPEGVTELDFSKPVGCSSRRRMLQFQAMYPQAAFAPIRGNVYTRLAKVDSGNYAATILAAAGLKRLGLEQRISQYFSVDEMIPAAGQGVLALQGRISEDYTFLQEFCSEKSRITSICERAFIRELDGGCSSPIAAYAEVDGDIVVLRGLYYEECSGKTVKEIQKAPVSEAEKLGIMLARRLKQLTVI